MKIFRNMLFAGCFLLQILMAVVFGFSEIEVPNMVWLACWCVPAAAVYFSSDKRETI